MSAAELSFGKTRKFLGSAGALCDAPDTAALACLEPKSCEGVRTAIPNAEQPSSTARRRFGNFMDPQERSNTTSRGVNTNPTARGDLMTFCHDGVPMRSIADTV